MLVLGTLLLEIVEFEEFDLGAKIALGNHTEFCDLMNIIELPMIFDLQIKFVMKCHGIVKYFLHIREYS